MTDKLILTTAQRDAQIEALTNSKEAIATSLHFGVDEVQAASDISSLNAAIDMLQSLPMVSGAPVAWMVTTEMQDGTRSTYPTTGRYKHVRDVCDFGEPIPLYTHAQPLTPITADDVTDEMRTEFQTNSTFGGLSIDLIVAAYNAVIKHRSEA